MIRKEKPPKEATWTLLNKFVFVEIWKTTNNSYLACYKYGGVFKFFRTYQEAYNCALELVKELK